MQKIIIRIDFWILVHFNRTASQFVFILHYSDVLENFARDTVNFIKRKYKKICLYILCSQLNVLKTWSLLFIFLINYRKDNKDKHFVSLNNSSLYSQFNVNIIEFSTPPKTVYNICCTKMFALLSLKMWVVLIYDIYGSETVSF